jgi:hypothetical protein
MQPKTPEPATFRKPDTVDRDMSAMAPPWFHLNRSRGRSSSSLDMSATAKLAAKS